MSEALCFQFYNDRELDETELVRALTDILGMKCESLEVRDPDANCFVIVQQYDVGFAQGVNVCWKSGVAPVADRLDAARSLATRFAVSVATDREHESIEGADYYRWCVAEPDGTLVEMTEEPTARASAEGLVLDPASRRVCL